MERAWGSGGGDGGGSGGDELRVGEEIDGKRDGSAPYVYMDVDRALIQGTMQ